MNKLAKDAFEHLSVFLQDERIERTNNHVERNNRAFRLLQKTRDKRRKVHTMEKAWELFLSARMLKHPLSHQNPMQRPIGEQGKTSHKIAAEGKDN